MLAGVKRGTGTGAEGDSGTVDVDSGAGSVTDE